MTQQTELLDPMAVLAANVGHDEDGAIILADKEWLAKSVFPTIWLHKDLEPTIFAPEDTKQARSLQNEANALFLELASGKKFTPKTEAHGDSFYIGADPRFNTDVLSWRQKRPEQPFRFWDRDTVQLDFLYLIDMATDELAKEIANIPAVLIKKAKKSDRRFYFRNAISERIPRFLFDEMPQILVNLLGYPFEWVAHHYRDHAITLYQLLYLLAEHKAGIGDGTFMYHYDVLNNNPDGPFLFFNGYDRVRFSFPLEGVFSPSDSRVWLDRTRGGRLFIKDLEHDWFYPRKMLKLQKANGDDVLNYLFNDQLQYLSFKEKGINKASLMQKVACNGVLSLYQGNFAEQRLARDIVKNGLTSSYWKGVYFPPVRF